jgi:hypothetical protein
MSTITVTTYAVVAAARNCVIVVYTPSVPCAESTRAINSLPRAASSSDLVIDPKAAPATSRAIAQPIVSPR